MKHLVDFTPALTRGDIRTCQVVSRPWGAPKRQPRGGTMNLPFAGWGGKTKPWVTAEHSLLGYARRAGAKPDRQLLFSGSRKKWVVWVAANRSSVPSLRWKYSVPAPSGVMRTYGPRSATVDEPAEDLVAMNDRRLFLIRKKFRHGGIRADEQKELDLLQDRVLSELESRMQGPADRLQEAEIRARSLGIDISR